MLEVLKTHVEGFDEALGGGVPKGSVVLVEGEPGSMKSTFIYNILHGCASKDDMDCLYITLEQRKVSLEAQMETMGFEKEAAFGKLAIMDVVEYRKQMETFSGDKIWLDFLKKCVETRRDVGNIDVVAIDSLDALEALSDFSDRRIMIYTLFEWLRDCEFTTFLVAETGPEFILHGHEVIPQKNDAEYLADAIISLEMKRMDDYGVQRRVRCVKMRRQNHETANFAMMFDKGSFKVAKAVSV